MSQPCQNARNGHRDTTYDARSTPLIFQHRTYHGISYTSCHIIYSTIIRPHLIGPTRSVSHIEGYWGEADISQAILIVQALAHAPQCTATTPSTRLLDRSCPLTPSTAGCTEEGMVDGDGDQTTGWDGVGCTVIHTDIWRGRTGEVQDDTS